MKKFVTILAISSLLLGQNMLPQYYKMKSINFDSSAHRGLKTNIIGDIEPQSDTLLWLGTGTGLAVLRDTSSIYTLTSNKDIQEGQASASTPDGAVSALAVNGNSLFAAFAKSGENITIGNGLIYSSNSTGNTISWTYFNQLVDTEADSLSPFAKRFFRGLPITVKEANVTYDASINGNNIYITSWAGGLRRYNTSTKIWQRIPLPQDNDQTLNTCDESSYITTSSGSILKDFYLNPRDPIDGGNHNHKAFSVISYSDTVWVGTANGINRGLIGANGCINWTHYTPNADGLSGGFVVDLAIQRYKGYNIIWAATVLAEQGEVNGVSYSIDGGDTWNSTLIGERAYNITASDSIVLVATKSGLWKTIIDDPADIAKAWAKYKPAKQALEIGSTGTYKIDEVLSDEVVAVSYDKRPFYSSDVTIWISSWDGLARAMNAQGSNWQIYRTSYDPKKAYAYPNPFSPYEHNQLQGDGYVHININVKVSFVVKMDVFNFAMEKVAHKEFDRRRTSTGSFKWNGKDASGRIVDNGVYFIRLEFDEKVEWIKLIVVK
ncbi:MAG: hypothetical protein VX177_03705 [Candidatus Neomarinimicrobiota bacterium]|jgi:hypothetical protein|nr:hypothetical protein [Candidatus Neomarinimicrobiota bacterium]|tara:strand:+ start:2268 stop:3914 length:1647 start_codon:yes stop_codon:yes gene_type:complete